MARELSPQTRLGRHGFARPGLTRRRAVQAGSIGMLGLADLCHLRSAAGTTADRSKAVILIFLSGGLAARKLRSEARRAARYSG